MTSWERQYDALRNCDEGHRLNLARARADKRASIFSDAWYKAVIEEYRNVKRG